MNPVIVAIDGEASTGKSTQAKKIAEELDFDYRDSGAYYRALTLYLIQNNINSNENIPQTILDKIHLKQTFKDNKLIIYLNNEDVSNKIRGYKVSIKVSSYAKKPEIRNFVYAQLRKSAKSNSLIIDGRDIGTVVFPDADFKFFLFADSKVRAERRHKQINDKSVKLESIEKEIKTRDNIDSTRKIAPLKKADDAYEIDVTSLSITQVFDKILQKINSK
ncbi:(d)CMP kinase [Flavobacteriaceae bacterium]|nr:(d)CMP kinase [Flavobacteriaceae bacterium]MDA8630662.1 (d)CMP kinase [Flavobacteriaceae bacterium]MDA9850717.1 (d)CMP kinase [Flavobacteriaceae bacterium]MDC0559726.1 (d)CMP kinase [Flavobacteriaceae bacterium]MDC6473311.1 (d)CMP kinase [Flavobacteriaceae bacterium]